MPNLIPFRQLSSGVGCQIPDVTSASALEDYRQHRVMFWYMGLSENRDPNIVSRIVGSLL